MKSSRICPFCHNEFFCESWRKENRCCSPSCGVKYGFSKPKICKVCNQIFKGKAKSCLLCRKLKRKKYLENRNKEYGYSKRDNDWQRKLGRIIRHHLIDIAGGQCLKCGYKNNRKALAFHHKNPEEKLFGITADKVRGKTLEQLYLEISKCELLCHNCHTETHYPT